MRDHTLHSYQLKLHHHHHHHHYHHYHHHRRRRRRHYHNKHHRHFRDPIITIVTLMSVPFTFPFSPSSLVFVHFEKYLQGYFSTGHTQSALVNIERNFR